MVTIGYAGAYEAPYGINGWYWTLASINAYKRAGVYRFRVMVSWRHLEPRPGEFIWTGEPGSSRWHDLDFHLANFRAADRGASRPIKVSLCVFDSPAWARRDPLKVLSYVPERYAAFISTLLHHCDRMCPGMVESVEVENEHPTNAVAEYAFSYAAMREFPDELREPQSAGIRPRPASGMDQRDASWYYADILRAAYEAVKRHSPMLTVVMDGIWAFQFNHLDDLYQLGCASFFDRINFHYYNRNDMGDYSAPLTGPDERGPLHFPTMLAYVRHIADVNGDTEKPVWLTEFGWRPGEQAKARHLTFSLDTCRVAGYVERVHYYVGLGHLDNEPDPDPAGLMYITVASFDREYNWEPLSVTFAPAYHRLAAYTRRHPVWSRRSIPDAHVVPLPPGGPHPVPIANPGFEEGSGGWSGRFSIDREMQHAGTACALMRSGGSLGTTFTVVPRRAYELLFHASVAGEDSEAVMCEPVLTFVDESGRVEETTVCTGLVDTRRYPGGWRWVRSLLVAPEGTVQCQLHFLVKGGDAVRIDDVSVIPLRLRGHGETHH